MYIYILDDLYLSTNSDIVIFSTKFAYTSHKPYSKYQQIIENLNRFLKFQAM